MKGKAEIIWGGQNTKEKMRRGSKGMQDGERLWGKRKAGIEKENVWRGHLAAFNPVPWNLCQKPLLAFRKLFPVSLIKTQRAKCPINLSEATLASCGRAMHVGLGSPM